MAMQTASTRRTTSTIKTETLSFHVPGVWAGIKGGRNTFTSAGFWRWDNGAWAWSLTRPMCPLDELMCVYSWKKKYIKGTFWHVIKQQVVFPVFAPSPLPSKFSYRWEMDCISLGLHKLWNALNGLYSVFNHKLICIYCLTDSVGMRAMLGSVWWKFGWGGRLGIYQWQFVHPLNQRHAMPWED